MQSNVLEERKEEMQSLLEKQNLFQQMWSTQSYQYQLLILFNRRFFGSLLLVIAVTFILIVKDNPWLRHNSMKSSQKEVKEKFNNFVENLGLLGSALLLMFHRGASSC